MWSSPVPTETLLCFSWSLLRAAHLFIVIFLILLKHVISEAFNKYTQKDCNKNNSNIINFNSYSNNTFSLLKLYFMQNKFIHNYDNILNLNILISNRASLLSPRNNRRYKIDRTHTCTVDRQSSVNLSLSLRRTLPNTGSLCLPGLAMLPVVRNPQCRHWPETFGRSSPDFPGEAVRNPSGATSRCPEQVPPRKYR